MEKIDLSQEQSDNLYKLLGLEVYFYVSLGFIGILFLFVVIVNQLFGYWVVVFMIAPPIAFLISSFILQKARSGLYNGKTKTYKLNILNAKQLSKNVRSSSTSVKFKVEYIDFNGKRKHVRVICEFKDGEEFFPNIICINRWKYYKRFLDAKLNF